MTAHDFDQLAGRGIGLLSIGGHDSSDEVIRRARSRFGSAWRDLRVGEPIVVMGVPVAEAGGDVQPR